ncbi:unnamed protein product, partial [Trichobilharzia regenti]
FIRTRRFQPSLEFISHVSGPTAWRPTFDNILQIITCCVQPEFWSNSTQNPYISVEMITKHKGDYDSLSNSNIMKETSESRTQDSTLSSYTTDADDWFYLKPRRRITVVEGTNRLIAPLFRNVIPDQTLGDVLQNLFPEISCEYREAKSEILPNTETRGKYHIP